jgi:TPR repeat protein
LPYFLRVLRTLGWAFALLCTLGSIAACSDYDEARRVYVAGRYDDAFSRMLKLAQAGDNRAQYDVAMMYVQGIGTKKDLEVGFGWMIEAGKSGNVGAMNELGAIYESGVGAARNLGVAFQWYMRAAKSNDAVGLFNAANMLSRGIGVPQDVIRGWALYMRAAANGTLTGRVRADQMEETMSAAQMKEARALLKRLEDDPASE